LPSSTVTGVVGSTEAPIFSGEMGGVCEYADDETAPKMMTANPTRRQYANRLFDMASSHNFRVVPRLTKI
jgi:hypothetical protein